jgi:hypothetical protein
MLNYQRVSHLLFHAGLCRKLLPNDISREIRPNVVDPWDSVKLKHLTIHQAIRSLSQATQ